LVKPLLPRQFSSLVAQFVLIVNAAILLVCGASCFAQTPVPNSPAIEHRVDMMVSKLTLEQKIELIGGYNDSYIRAEPALAFPQLKMSDGPEGLQTWGPSTAYAGGIALAASWDPTLAGRMGVALGQDARARGVHFLLAPGVNIARAPMDSRNFEYFGEDPFLAARIAVPYIEGVQIQGVISVVKHFAANNQEYNRYEVSSDVDERALRELYLPAFEAAVKEAHVGSVMDALNLVNGEHATQNAHLNVDILKKEWGFDGILMSDWGSTYDGVAAANGGLDLEMPSGKCMNLVRLLPAVRSGKVSESVIDDKVRRIFRTAIRFGFLDRDQTDIEIPLNNPASRKVALDTARESVVLLKNEHNVLPLDASNMHTLAVIGPDAWPAVTGGGGSSSVTPYTAVSLMAGLGDYLGEHTKVLYARGLPTAGEVFKQTKFGTAIEKAAHNDIWTGPRTVKIEAFSTPDFSGTPGIWSTRRIDSVSEDQPPIALDTRSIRYSAVYTPEKTGNYMFLMEGKDQDAYTLLVDGEQKFHWQPQHELQFPVSVDLPLTAGKPVHIQLDYLPSSARNRMSLGIRAVDELISPEAKRIAATANAVVVSVGFDPATEQEGLDRSFALPWGQDLLIESMAHSNRNTIVILTGGGNVVMRRWLANVPALLHDWYPGQEGARAVSEILFGERSPEGHLPVSFEQSWEDSPVHDNYYAPPVSKGEVPRIKYAEGVFVGYRYYTTYGKKPLFPFGYGLSYTTFAFSNLRVTPASPAKHENVEVSFDVTNTGERSGADVAQVYVGDPSAKVKRPDKELGAFTKVRLAPGKKQHIAVSLDWRRFAYWSTAANDWQIDPGNFTIFVGDSSEDTPLMVGVTRTD
jgi:beta-glucosidase